MSSKFSELGSDGKNSSSILTDYGLTTFTGLFDKRSGLFGKDITSSSVGTRVRKSVSLVLVGAGGGILTYFSFLNVFT